MSFATMTIHTGASRMETVGSSFAYDLAKRISRSKGLEAAQAVDGVEVDESQAKSLAEKTSQLRKLENALSSTVSYMTEKHGGQAASVMIGIVYKSIGGGEINEQTLGEAFLDVTRFIDKNFGTDAGDGFMRQLNGSLNHSMNEFFDNGLAETFMVAPSSGASDGTAVAGVEGLLSEITEQYVQTIKEMLEEARANPGQSNATAAYANPGNKNILVGVMKDLVV